MEAEKHGDALRGLFVLHLRCLYHRVINAAENPAFMRKHSRFQSFEECITWSLAPVSAARTLA